MEKNQIVTIKIEDIGIHGEGIGKYDGYTLFVKDTVPGDVAKVRITRAKKNYGYGRLEELLEKSVDRVEAVCPVARSCGGCQIQQMSYEKQLEWKEKKVVDHLVRLGGFHPQHIKEVMEPICGMEKPYHYRNKAQYPLGRDKNGKLTAGFYAGRTHQIIPFLDCKIGWEGNEKIVSTILTVMENEKISPYDESTGKGLIRHVMIRRGRKTGQVMVCLVINGKKQGKVWFPGQEILTEELKKIDGMVSFCVSPNEKNTNVILGDSYEVIWGKPYMEEAIGEVIYEISPLSFFQVNPVQTEKLYQKVLEYADLKGEEQVWDLYCGIGTISLFLAGKARQVYGVEVVPQAIEDAKKNAKKNHITNAEFFVGKAEEVIPAWWNEDKSERKADVVVVDPPRKGCEESLLRTMLEMGPERIVYVSCDSATLARDLKVLCERDYQISRVQAFDQFCHTVHVEAIVLLSKLDSKKYISVELTMDDIDLTSIESKVTYKQIQNYVLEKFRFKVSTLYIAQVKKKHGLEVREHYNIPKNENQKVPQCPIEKEEAILDALKHFKML